METLVRRACVLGTSVQLLFGAIGVQAQSAAPVDARKIHRTASIGVSFFHGDEGDNTGAHLTATALRAAGSARLAIRFDLLAHYFTPQPLYPCGLVIGDRCFQTSQRSVIGAAVGLERAFSSAARGVRSRGFYGAASVAGVFSRRVAERFVSCEPGEFCPPSHDRESVRDPSSGLLFALGWAAPTGARASVYGEASVLYPFARKRTDADVYKEYWIFPISIGVRF